MVDKQNRNIQNHMHTHSKEQSQKELIESIDFFSSSKFARWQSHLSFDDDFVIYSFCFYIFALFRVNNINVPVFAHIHYHQ